MILDLSCLLRMQKAEGGRSDMTHSEKRVKRWILCLFSLVIMVFVFRGSTLRVHAAKNVRLAQTSVNLTVGKTKKLSVKNAPRGAKITYKSSKKSVATVSGKGKITGKKAGTAKITVTVKNKKKKTKLICKVTVKKAKTVKTATPAKKPAGTGFSGQYMAGPYYRALMNVRLTGNYREDMIAVAESQIGYHEGDSQNQIDGTAYGSNNFSEYGRYLGSNGSAWCSEFASWCARQARVPTSILANSRAASIRNFGAPYHTWKETVFAGGKYVPRAGDLVLFAWNGTSARAEYLSHTAIVYSVQSQGDTVDITVIHGNSNDCVRKSVFCADADTGYVGKGTIVYFVAPRY